MLRRVDTDRPRAMAEAVFKPSALLLAGAGVSAAILGGLPLLAAAGIGVAAWAARVALALPRRRFATDDRITAKDLMPPWRGFVREAEDAEHRFAQVVQSTPTGPLRDRLAEVGGRLAEGVTECGRVAQRGQQLQKAVKQLDIEQLPATLDRARSAAQRDPTNAELAATVEALEEQVASFQRLRGLIESTADRLQRLNAQLDESVARAVEVSVGVGDVAGVAPIGSDVDALVGELEALRQGLEEAGRAGGTATA